VGKRHRAIPLAPDERRRAIVAAVIPLLIERGSSVTTKEMAEAAGIAEGTIFRVFPDKAALIHEALEASFDPRRVQEELAAVYEDAPLATQLAEAARILLERLDTVLALMAVLRTMPHDAFPGHVSGPPRFVVQSNAAINDSLAVIFERHRDQLRIEPARAASIFRGLILANAHPALSFGERLTVDELVNVLLMGIVQHAESTVA
jgi:AcrR family transcriptional regulator